MSIVYDSGFADVGKSYCHESDHLQDANAGLDTRDSSTVPGKWGVYGTMAEGSGFGPTFGHAALEDPEVQVLGPGVRLAGAQRAVGEHPKGLYVHSALACLTQSTSATSSMLTHLKTFTAWHQCQRLLLIAE